MRQRAPAQSLKQPWIAPDPAGAARLTALPLPQLPAKLQDAVERADAVDARCEARWRGRVPGGGGPGGAKRSKRRSPRLRPGQSAGRFPWCRLHPSGVPVKPDSEAPVPPSESAAGDADAKPEDRAQMTAWLRRRRRMLFLEAEIAADRYFELGKRTLAVLRGEFSRFEMRSKEVRTSRARRLCARRRLSRATCGRCGRGGRPLRWARGWARCSSDGRPKASPSTLTCPKLARPGACLRGRSATGRRPLRRHELWRWSSCGTHC